MIEEQYKGASNRSALGKRLYLSTLSDKAAGVGRRYGLGLEISEFCTAYNMDKDFLKWDERVKGELQGINKRILHAPFNELCPAAIDPLIVEVAKRRYEQAFRLAQGYSINRMVIHAGHVPAIYYNTWFVERSVEFWREFLSCKPENLCIMLENVLETDPEPLAEIVQKVGDPRLGLCLDMGHANINSKRHLIEWIDVLHPYLKHVHIHDNEGIRDQHLELGEGTIPMERVLRRIEELCPETTYTLETMNPESSVRWLMGKAFLKEDEQ